MDDDSGWDGVLVDGWGPLVRAAVVARVEAATAGRHGFLVRAVQEGARYALAEELHRLVLAAIQIETGADLEQLGSQAAWACYDDAWGALAQRWRAGDPLAAVRHGEEAAVVHVVGGLPAWLAEAAGADAGTIPAVPLTAGGRMRLDVEGLFAALHGGRPLTDEQRREVAAIVALTE